MAKPKFDVNYVLARRDISTPSSGSGTSELFLMLLLTVSAFVGFLSEVRAGTIISCHVEQLHSDHICTHQSFL